MKRWKRELLPEWFFNFLLRIRGGNAPCPYKDFNTRYQAIFIHIPKTAGSSVSKTLGNDGSKHQMLKYYEAYDPKRFRSYYKFTFTRNPYDRLVSAYHYVLQIENDFDQVWATTYLNGVDSFSDFVHRLKNPVYRNQVFKHLVFKPQHQFVQDLNGQIAIDFVGRFENLEEDFKIICERLKIANTLLFSNRSKHDPYHNYYTPELAALVYSYYKEDFIKFGYESELS